jgi:hypothetical protein
MQEEYTVLTGDTLNASLKMRTDTTDASYSIFWSALNGMLVVSGDYVADKERDRLLELGLKSSFAEKSEAYVLDMQGNGPVAMAYRSGAPVFIPDVSKSNMKRKGLAETYGIKQVAMIPMEGGIMEYGTSEGGWSSVPTAPTMPKVDMRRGFENFGASYCLFWQKQANGYYSAVAEHTTDERKAALRKARGDDKTFASESMKLKLDSRNPGGVATAARTGKEVVLTDMTKLSKRSELAEEFGIIEIHFVPHKDGVFEFGTPAENFLSGALMEASLKMRCDNTGAGYALYWKETNGKLTLAGDYITAEQQASFKEQGKSTDIAEAARAVTVDLAEESSIAKVARDRSPLFVRDTTTCATTSSKLARDFGFQSTCFVPVEGGVMEYGIADGWKSNEDAMPAVMPKAEMKKAFANGATHVIFWRQNGGSWEANASYVVPELTRKLQGLRSDEKSYTDLSKEVTHSVDDMGPTATAGRSGKEIVLEDPATAKDFCRKGLAKEFNVKNLHFVPCRDGVLEYGTSQI